MIEYLETLITSWLESMNISSASSSCALWIIFAAVLVIAYGLYYLVKEITTLVVKKITGRTGSLFQHSLLEKKFFARAAYIPSLIILNIFVDLLFTGHPKTSHYLTIAINTASVFVITSIIMAVLGVLDDSHSRSKYGKEGSLKGIIQAAKTVIYCLAVIFCVSIIRGIKASVLFGALGAASAVMMLVFKDSILGLVGGIQLSLNRMVLPGDWIEVPGAGADGTVIEISQITVKVRNFDNTIVTVPTYNLIAQPVKNWRGMKEAGVRRIKRAVFIDMISVKFCTDEMLERYRKIQYLTEYVDRKQEEIAADNKAKNVNETLEVNGRRQTNLGVFREYLQRYLENHPQVSQNHTLMARQLDPTNNGIPVEVYVFANTTEWVEYEAIQSDIFDHIISAVPYFDLRVFQNPSGNDLKFMNALNRPVS
jgi:miniconductance mechanosensitive channel